MEIPTRPHTSVFGQRNHARLPRRNWRTMPRVSASGKTAAINNDGSPDFHIPTAQPKTTSTTYVHPRASTILTGNGFFIPSPAFVAKHHSQPRLSGIRRPCFRCLPMIDEHPLPPHAKSSHMQLLTVDIIPKTPITRRAANLPRKPAFYNGSAGAPTVSLHHWQENSSFDRIICMDTRTSALLPFFLRRRCFPRLPSLAAKPAT